MEIRLNMSNSTVLRNPWKAVFHLVKTFAGLNATHCHVQHCPHLDLLIANLIQSECSVDIYVKSKPRPPNLSHPFSISDQNVVRISHVSRLSHVAWSRSILTFVNSANPMFHTHNLCNSNRNYITKGTGALRAESTDPRRQLRPFPDALLPFHFVTSLKGSICPQLCFSMTHAEADSRSREGEYLRKVKGECVQEKFEKGLGHTHVLSCTVLPITEMKT
jgi:hypothetical protein